MITKIFAAISFAFIVLNSTTAEALPCWDGIKDSCTPPKCVSFPAGDSGIFWCEEY